MHTDITDFTAVITADHAAFKPAHYRTKLPTKCAAHRTTKCVSILTAYITTISLSNYAT
jgi:hypothetical protein